MRNFISKLSLKKSELKKGKKELGFTLLELIIVIILLGVMSVGISSFITLGTQTYLNVTNRDEILSSARFAIERLNRELRNAVPNSIRIHTNATSECLEFVPIKASTSYIDIPVIPDAASSLISVIPFLDINANPYQCNATCLDKVTIYPLDNSDIYANPNQVLGQTFSLNSVNIINANEWQIALAGGNNINFNADSPTNRLYIFESPVSYCLELDKLNRYEGYPVSNAAYVLPSEVATIQPVLMAEQLSITAVGTSFAFLPPTLQRNAIVQTSLHFTQNGEDNIFNNEIHIKNTP